MSGQENAARKYDDRSFVETSGLKTENIAYALKLAHRNSVHSLLLQVAGLAMATPRTLVFESTTPLIPPLQASLLNAGADLVLNGAMSANEKQARRTAVFRRAGLVLSTEPGLYSEIEIPLSKTELFIFVRLLKNLSAVTAKTEIAQDILPGVGAKSRTVDVHLSSLRQKLPVDLKIENVHGYGIRLQRC